MTYRGAVHQWKSVG